MNQVPDYFIKKKKKKFKYNEKLDSLLFFFNNNIILYINNNKVKKKDININIFNTFIYLKIKNINIDKVLIKNININISINKTLKTIMNFKNTINIEKLFIKIFISTHNIFYNLYFSLKDIYNFNFRQLIKRIKINLLEEFKDNKKVKYYLYKINKDKNLEFWEKNSKFDKFIFWSSLKYKEKKI